MRRSLVFSALLGGAFGWGCDVSRCQNQSASWLADSPKPTLCPTDSMHFTPNTATLIATQALASHGVGGGTGATPLDASGGMAAAGTTNAAGAAGTSIVGGGTETLDMALVAQDEEGQPLDTMNVDVSVEGAKAYVELQASPTGTECKALTVTQLRCATTASGIARFVVAHAHKGSGEVTLRAASGNRSHDATATIQVRDVGPDSLDASLDTATLGFGADAALACGTNPTPAKCGTVSRNAGFRVASKTGTGTPLRMSVDLSVKLTVSEVGGATGVVSLSGSPDCSSGTTALVTTIPVGEFETERAFVCGDGRAVTFDLDAEATGVPAFSRRFSIPGVPAAIAVVDASGGAGGASNDVAPTLEVLDCEKRPLAGIPLAWRALRGGSGTATTDALGTVAVAASGSLTLGITDPATNGLLECTTSLGAGQ